MRIKNLEIKNIGKIQDMNIEFDKPLNLFFGEIMQGKTTILNSVKYCFGGSFPDDVLRHDTIEGYVMLRFNGSSIRREFYRGSDGTVKARTIQYVCDGQVQKKPVQAIKQFLNPFLLDQDHFSKMSEIERSRFLVELFDIDTSDIDDEIKKNEESAKELRMKAAAYGEIDITEVPWLDESKLREERNTILQKWKNKKDAIEKNNKEIEKYNDRVRHSIDKKDIIGNKIIELSREVGKLKTEHEQLEYWLSINELKEIESMPARPDMLELEEKISDVKANNVRHEQYLVNLKRQESKEADRAKQLEHEKEIRELKKKKVKKLAELSDKSGVQGLEFDERGNLLFEKTSLGMLSMSQLMRLSSLLSELYPQGFGIELIDRGESLGKSIYEFIDRAKEEDKTILATIVGEKPAKVPDDIGVFVVEEGVLK